MKNIISPFSCLLFPLLLVVSNVSLSAKETMLEENTCYIHLDKSFYVTGEIVWYKLYLGNTFKGKPVTVKVVVADQKGKIINSYFLKTGGKTYLHGHYKIPFSALTGIYLLQFTGIDSATNVEVKLSEAAIPIFNDLQDMPKLVKQELKGEEAPKVALPNTLKVAISLPKNSFEQRDAIAPSIKVTDQSGNPVIGTVSVAVIDKNLAGVGKLEGTIVPNVTSFQEDMYIQGEVFDETENSVKSSIIGAFIAEDSRIFYSKVTDTGQFIMTFPEFYGDKHIQFLGNPKNVEYPSVKVQEKLVFTNTNELPFTEKIANYLNLSRQRKKIFQYYSTLESNPTIEKVKEKKSQQKANQEWNIKEYEYFEYMYIFFKENLSPLRFRFNNDSTYTAAMYNPANQTSDKYYEGKPLFIIDNIATRDGDFVARMKMADVQKVELFYNLQDLNRDFKLFGSSGVAKITSYQPLNKLPVRESVNSFILEGLQEKATFSVFHPDQIANNRRHPFFRPQLYWNPDLVTDKNGMTSFSYHQTDDKSTFLIQVVVQGENGQMGYATKEYVVE